MPDFDPMKAAAEANRAAAEANRAASARDAPTEPPSSDKGLKRLTIPGLPFRFYGLPESNDQPPRQMQPSRSGQQRSRR